MASSENLPQPILTLSNGINIRHFHHTDAPFIAHHANNRRIWLNMTDRFPNPYTLKDAQDWLDLNLDKSQTWHSTASPPDPSATSTMIPCNYCITCDGKPIGGCGIEFNSMPNEQRKAELGYWIGEEYWGRGIATELAREFSDWAFKVFPWVVRLEAKVYHWNPASMAVLRKAGFEESGVQKCAFWKDEKFVDSWMFVKIRDGVKSEAEAPA